MKLKLVTFLNLLAVLHLSTSFAQRQSYVVYLGDHNAKRTASEIKSAHHSFLSSVKRNKEEAKASLIHSYKNVINGFSAFLTPDEAAKLSEMEEVVSVFKSQPRRYKIQTTRSWEFVDLLSNGGGGSSLGGEQLLRKANYGQDIVVGVLDSGVWPESQSFSDDQMEPIPESWKGTCQVGIAFDASHCNRKLIGARYYLKGYEAYYGQLNQTLDYRSPRDSYGHGTHTASTVGGRRVPGASILGGFANGTASGGAPLVRLAIYKVCWQIPNQFVYRDITCFDEDVLAAFDEAIADGVHVISMSIVPYELNPYMQDGFAIGALHATRQNIVVLCSAGNDGPTPSSVRNVAPWIMTVAASSIDRIFSSPVILGNGMRIEGQSVTSYELDKMYPLVFAGDVELPGTTNSNTTGQCLLGTLSPELVKGKIVLCLSGYSYNAVKGLAVKRAGGIGFILQNPLIGFGISVQTHVLPGTAVFYSDAYTILNYIKTNQYPLAIILPAKTLLDTKPAPFMAGFSSAGPNGLEPNILKPDITAPGLNILAAWSEIASPTNLADDNRVVKYNIDSGTSMSCPHVAAAAALVKAVHPDWSSAAIRSALMTTAKQINNLGLPITDENGNVATPFRYGAGHFQPSKAIDPGLVYDANFTDYLLFLCNSGIDNVYKFKCPNEFPSPSNLNYPSVAVSRFQDSTIVERTVKNVGDVPSVYYVSIKPPVGYSVEIFPTTLVFRNVGQARSFRITITKTSRQTDAFVFGWYQWSDGTHVARSPIVASS
ncbi:hypothetical protein ACH5RR_015435, partial [Cinchona calisaya]